MAQSTNLKAKNISGATIKANSAVYINGVSDDDDALPTIALASNNSESKMPAVGLVRDDIANGESGLVKITGNIGAIDTNAAKKVNTPVYVGVNGAILFKNPSDTSDSAIVQQLGTVTYVGDVENGQVYLFPLEVQVKHAKTHKPDKSDPFIHASQHQLGGEDQIDHSKINGLDIDSHKIYSLTSGKRAFTGTVSGIDPTQASHLATKNYTDTTFIQGSGTSGYVAFFSATKIITGESGLFWDAANDRLGIGTASPQNKLDVEGAVAIGSSYSGTSVAPTNGLIVEGNVGIGVVAPQNKLDVEGAVAIGSSYSGTDTAPTNGLIVQGRVGIGTNSPAASSVLELNSTTGALLVPRMTTGERDALTAVDGMIIYNTTTAAFNKRQAGAWVAF